MFGSPEIGGWDPTYPGWQVEFFTTSTALAIRIREEAKAKKEATQFKPGDERQNPGGKPKAVVRKDSCEPQEKPRDHKAEHARSTVGQIAKEAGAFEGKKNGGRVCQHSTAANPS